MCTKRDDMSTKEFLHCIQYTCLRCKPQKTKGKRNDKQNLKKTIHIVEHVLFEVLIHEEPEMEPERQQLLERWKLVKDPAARWRTESTATAQTRHFCSKQSLHFCSWPSRYVIQTANSDDVLDVKNTEWNPSLKADRNPSFVLTTVTWP